MENLKKYWHKFINISFWFSFAVMIIMLALVYFMLIAQSTIMPMIAKHKAKDPNNVKTGGCLMYEGRMTGKGNASLYSLNGQDKKALAKLPLKNRLLKENGNLITTPLTPKACAIALTPINLNPIKSGIIMMVGFIKSLIENITMNALWWIMFLQSFGYLRWILFMM